MKMTWHSEPHILAIGGTQLPSHRMNAALSRPSSGRPSARLASTVSSPLSCNAKARILLAGPAMVMARLQRDDDCVNTLGHPASRAIAIALASAWD